MFSNSGLQTKISVLTRASQAGALILDAPPTKAVTNKYALQKLRRWWFSVQAAWTD